jgi:hypothetical protein
MNPVNTGLTKGTDGLRPAFCKAFWKFAKNNLNRFYRGGFVLPGRW